MKDTVTVFEGGRIDIPPGPRRHRAIERLLGVTVGKKQAFSLRKGNVFAGEFVGVVDVGVLKVEILPKPYGVKSTEEARVLMYDLLQWGGAGTKFAWFRGGASARDTDILGLVEKHAIRQLLRQLEIGVPRRYGEVVERSSTLRGRVLFSQYVRQLPSEAHILPIRFNPMITDNDLGRLLKALTLHLWKRANSYVTRRDLDRCLDLLASVSDKQLTPELVSRVRLGRLEHEWSSLVELAELLAAGQSPDPVSAGVTTQSTLLFPLNRLFEALIRRTLSLAMKPPFDCAYSPGEHPLILRMDAEGPTGVLSVKPDLLFRHDGEVAAPGDAKWKRIKNAPLSALPSDIYQLLAYMRRFSSQVGLLFFPRMEWMEPDWQVQHIVEPGRTECITILAVDIAELVSCDSEARQHAINRLTKRVQAVLPVPSSVHLGP